MAGKYTVITDKLELELRKMRADGRKKLPSEHELAESFSCSRQTVRAALDVLAKKGLIVKRTGSGSYLAEETFANWEVFFMTEDCDRYQSLFLINGLKEELKNSKYKLKTFSTSGNSADEKKVLISVKAEHPAALIIEPSHDLIPDTNERLIEEIRDIGIPVIYCNSALGPVNVTPDNRMGGKILTKKLMENGRKKITCIFRLDDSAGMNRYHGFLDAIYESEPDVPFDDSKFLLITHKDEREILSGNGKILSLFVGDLGDCDAVVCQDGMIAHCLVRYLQRHGVSVPGSIDVACFDNGYCSSETGIDMISAGFDEDVFCKRLAKTVISAVEGRSGRSSVIPMKIN